MCSRADAGKSPLVFPVQRWKEGGWSLPDDCVGEEVPLRVTGTGFGEAPLERRLWACPHDLAALALGHALLEMAPAAMQTGQIVVRALPDVDGEKVFEVICKTTAAQRQICSQDVAAQQHAWAPEQVLEGMKKMLAAPGQWDGSGCFHRAALYESGGECGFFLHLAEDIGRHNCLDRLAGWAWKNEIEPGNCVLFVTARITASFYAKARRAGFLFLVSRSAVTSAAVSAARKQGVTLIGFCRPAEQRLTVFADSKGRIACSV